MARKIKLHGSPTTKELKKKHSFRLVGGVEMGIQGQEDVQQRGWWTWAGKAVASRWDSLTFV